MWWTNSEQHIGNTSNWNLSKPPFIDVHRRVTGIILCCILYLKICWFWGIFTDLGHAAIYWLAWIHVSEWIHMYKIPAWKRLVADPLWLEASWLWLGDVRVAQADCRVFSRNVYDTIIGGSRRWITDTSRSVRFTMNWVLSSIIVQSTNQQSNPFTCMSGLDRDLDLDY